jgi:tRNA-2-methylthio-N6-dimethylallyladenosine synthase
VFDGTDRLIGQTVRVAVRDASPFTLYGDVEMATRPRVPAGGEQQGTGRLTPAVRPERFSLPLV